MSSRYKKQALATLKQEGLTHDGFSSFNLKGETYIIAISIGQHLPVDMKNKLNQKHGEVKKECLEYIETADIGYYLKS